MSESPETQSAEAEVTETVIDAGEGNETASETTSGEGGAGGVEGGEGADRPEKNVAAEALRKSNETRDMVIEQGKSIAQLLAIAQTLQTKPKEDTEQPPPTTTSEEEIIAKYFPDIEPDFAKRNVAAMRQIIKDEQAQRDQTATTKKKEAEALTAKQYANQIERAEAAEKNFASKEFGPVLKKGPNGAISYDLNSEIVKKADVLLATDPAVRSVKDRGDREYMAFALAFAALKAEKVPAKKGAGSFAAAGTGGAGEGLGGGAVRGDDKLQRHMPDEEYNKLSSDDKDLNDKWCTLHPKK